MVSERANKYKLIWDWRLTLKDLSDKTKMKVRTINFQCIPVLLSVSILYQYKCIMSLYSSILNELSSMCSFESLRPIVLFLKLKCLWRLETKRDWLLLRCIYHFKYRLKADNCLIFQRKNGRAAGETVPFSEILDNYRLLIQIETSTKMYTPFLIGLNLRYGPYAHFGYWTLVSDP